MTAGASEPVIKLIPSDIREKPGPDVLVKARRPPKPAPSNIFAETISLSACINVPPTSGNLLDRYSGIELCGVMGNPAYNLHPLNTALSAIATLPSKNCIVIDGTSPIDGSANYCLYTLIAISGHIKAQMAQPVQLSFVDCSA
jgi:hypothetical protein